MAKLGGAHDCCRWCGCCGWCCPRRRSSPSSLRCKGKFLPLSVISVCKRAFASAQTCVRSEGAGSPCSPSNRCSAASCRCSWHCCSSLWTLRTLRSCSSTSRARSKSVGRHVQNGDTSIPDRGACMSAQEVCRHIQHYARDRRLRVPQILLGELLHACGSPEPQAQPCANTTRHEAPVGKHAADPPPKTLLIFAKKCNCF